MCAPSRCGQCIQLGEEQSRIEGCMKEPTACNLPVAAFSPRAVHVDWLSIIWNWSLAAPLSIFQPFLPRAMTFPSSSWLCGPSSIVYARSRSVTYGVGRCIPSSLLYRGAASVDSNLSYLYFFHSTEHFYRIPSTNHDDPGLYER